MSFELKPGQSLRKGIRRIVRKQIDDALAELAGEPRDEAVHEARKCFKKVRAMLRLVRPAIGVKTYRAENTCFRDAARPLTEVRDARILIETLDKLTEHFHELLAGRAFADIGKALEDNLRAVRKHVLDDGNAFATVSDVIRQATERVKSWTAVSNRWASIGEGLEATYRRAAAAYAKAAAEPTVQSLHEWRKQVKYVRYQLEVLRPVWPERLDELVNEAAHMGDLLGDDHDLAVLRQILTDEPARFGEPADREVLLALIERRRADLERTAMLLADRYFQERPRTFVRRVKAYWNAWRAEAAASHTEPSAVPAPGS